MHVANLINNEFVGTTELGAENEEPVSIREQIVSELSMRGQRRKSNRSRELDKRVSSRHVTPSDDKSWTQLRLYEQVSDITKTFGEG